MANGVDPRFDVHKDPRFKRLSTKKRKVTLDDRFKCIVEDPSFDTTVDPRTGRKSRSKTAKQDFRKLYIADAATNEDDTQKKLVKDSVSDTSADSSDDSSETSSHFSWNEESDSSDDDADEEKRIDNTEESIWDTYSSNIPMAVETSSRIAILGCDWDCVTSQDLYVLLSSFTSTVGTIKRVAIYLSDFGQERLEYESQHGPVLDINKEQTELEISNSNTEITEEENPVNDERAVEAIRKYQKERSRYYFAVVECDTVETADFLYKELEGVDCDFCTDGLDLRFIPDSYPAFTASYPKVPRCEATSRSTRGYEPPAAFVSALRHSKARCTWDETPIVRTRRLRKHFNAKEMAALDLEEYLASSCSGSPVSSDCGSQNGEDVDDTFATAVSIDAIELPANIKRTTAQNMTNSEKQDQLEVYRRKLLGDAAETHAPVAKQPVHYTDDIELVVPANDVATDAANDTGDKENAHQDRQQTPWEKYLEKRKQKRRERKHRSDGKPIDHENNDEDDMHVHEEKSSKKKSNKFPLIASGQQPTIDLGSRTDKLRTKGSSVGLLPHGIQSTSDSDTEVCGSQSTKHQRAKRKGKLGSDRITNIEKTAQVDFGADTRFKELFTNPHLTVDTTNPKFKMSEAYQKLLSCKLGKRKNRQE